MDTTADSVTSEELALDSMEIATVDNLEQDSKILAAGAMETTTEDGLVQQSFLPDSLLPESQPALCVRCGTTHDDNDVEGSWIMDDRDKFDCEIYIPDVENLQMDGDTILVPEHVLKKLDEQKKMKQDAKKDQ
ncbi:hypothetical protein C2845_PM04G07190 [Panicum miliaceum]|uniref:Uncharacterized protein n=1 Tax=Panicum miliaceum TaxID=4540 RepID=A0A3L6QMK9_PANMI|nr:hypothetical protein C2845_PM04G07190 [Panicum miliaceum]